MKKINEQGIIIIGGDGHWSRKTYIPALQPPFFNGIIYLCDIKKNISIECGNCKKIIITKKNALDIIKKIIIQEKIHIVIISTPPESHFVYLRGLIKFDVNIICDKPLISIVKKNNKNICKEILKKYYKIIHERENSVICTPLRRRVQGFYTKIYDAVELVQKKFGQNVTFLEYYENDGVHRWNNEVEFDFAHGYKTGLGKLSHTGYHILDIVANIILLGNQNINTLRCEILDENKISDISKSKSNMILQKLLKTKNNDCQLKKLSKEAELDISIKITMQYEDDIESNYYVFLRHSGVSNRLTKNYTKDNTGDQGRVDDSQFLIEQGACQCVYGNVIARSTLKGSVGRSRFVIKRHPIVSKTLKVKQNESYSLNNQSDISTIDIVKDIVFCLSNKKIANNVLEFSQQLLTMELYCATLYSKQYKKSITWKLGKLYDCMH